MNIVMMTNTFTPHVGGVARSIEQFTEQYRNLGHNVLVIAPEFDSMPENESGVIRIPAFRHFNHTDFSLIKPVPHFLQNSIDAFKPDIVHSHHPFLVGNIALRVAHSANVPLVFTHHTKYEDYTHNVSIDTEQAKRFAINLATNYANTCEQVFAPSGSMKEIIQQRGVRTRIDIVPTGVKTDIFATSDKSPLRRELGIDEDAFVVGHLGRITKEKNIEVLVASVIEFLQSTTAPARACFIICGEGPAMDTVDDLFSRAGLNEKLHKVGIIEKEQVPNAFAAMDVFAFTSQSETQGMVITEAMAAGTPVVALDAPGVRDVVKHGVNGLLLHNASQSEFANAIQAISEMTTNDYQAMVAAARSTAQEFSMPNSARIALTHYQRCITDASPNRPADFSGFAKTIELFESEWQVLSNTIRAAADSAV